MSKKNVLLVDDSHDVTVRRRRVQILENLGYTVVAPVVLWYDNPQLRLRAVIKALNTPDTNTRIPDKIPEFCAIIYHVTDRNRDMDVLRSLLDNPKVTGDNAQIIVLFSSEADSRALEKAGFELLLYKGKFGTDIEYMLVLASEARNLPSGSGV